LFGWQVLAECVPVFIAVFAQMMITCQVSPFRHPNASQIQIMVRYSQVLQGIDKV